jgi:hypothetical protein
VLGEILKLKSGTINKFNINTKGDINEKGEIFVRSCAGHTGCIGGLSTPIRDRHP